MAEGTEQKKAPSTEIIERLLAKGKKNGGSLTYGELIDALQKQDMSPDEMDDMYQRFTDEGVDIVDEASAAEEMTAEKTDSPESASEREDDSHPVGTPNPMIEYPDVPALERAIGFPILYLPSNFYALYHPAVHVYGISGQVADLRFKGKADDTAITLRTALEERIFTTDISGVYGANWQTQSAGDVKRTQVDVATLADGTSLNPELITRFTAGYDFHIPREEQLFDLGDQKIPEAELHIIGKRMAARRQG